MTTFQTSQIQNFTDALLEHLAARPGLSGVLITDGPPPASMLQVGEWLMLGDVTGEQDWYAIDGARKPREETFEVEGLVSVVQATTAADSGHQGPLNHRALAIVAEVEDELRSAPTQGIGTTGSVAVPYLVVAETSEIRLVKRASDTAREAAAFFKVKVRCRI